MAGIARARLLQGARARRARRGGAAARARAREGERETGRGGGEERTPPPGLRECWAPAPRRPFPPHPDADAPPPSSLGLAPSAHTRSRARRAPGLVPRWPRDALACHRRAQGVAQGPPLRLCRAPRDVRRWGRQPDEVEVHHPGQGGHRLGRRLLPPGDDIQRGVPRQAALREGARRCAGAGARPVARAHLAPRRCSRASPSSRGRARMRPRARLPPFARPPRAPRAR